MNHCQVSLIDSDVNRAAPSSSLVSQNGEQTGGSLPFIEDGIVNGVTARGLHVHVGHVRYNGSVCKQTERDLAQTERVSSAALYRDGTLFTEGRRRDDAAGKWRSHPPRRGRRGGGRKESR